MGSLIIVLLLSVLALSSLTSISDAISGRPNFGWVNLTRG